MSLTPALLLDDAPVLQAMVRRQIAELERIQREHRAAIERMREQLHVVLARRFGFSRERFPEEHPRLFNEAEVEDAESLDDSTVEVL